MLLHLWFCIVLCNKTCMFPMSWNRCYGQENLDIKLLPVLSYLLLRWLLELLLVTITVSTEADSCSHLNANFSTKTRQDYGYILVLFDLSTQSPASVSAFHAFTYSIIRQGTSCPTAFPKTEMLIPVRKQYNFCCLAISLCFFVQYSIDTSITAIRTAAVAPTSITSLPRML